MKYIYLLGVFAHNRRIYNNYKFMKKSEKWSLNKLREYQFTKFKELISYAYDNSEYYRKKFDDHHLNLQDIAKLKDIQLLPILTKEELLLNLKQIQIINCGEKVVLSETSGSTGKPIVFYRNKDWDAWHNAAVYRGYSWHGVQPWENSGYLWGYNIAPSKRFKVKMLDALQNRFRLFTYNDKEVSSFLKKLRKASYLEGYSSMIYEIAKAINSRNQSEQIKLKMIKGTSEKIFDVYQIEAKKAFGKKIVSEYGCAEGGIIAFECNYGNMHINMETVIVESDQNEIILTNLVSKSFPVIRYKLGDYIEVDDKTKCDCGMAHPIIKEVTGRVGKNIYGYNNKYPSLTLYYVFKNLALNDNVVINYQAVQYEAGKLMLYIEETIDCSQQYSIDKEFKKYFDNDLTVTIVQQVGRDNYTEKRKDFISMIDCT